ncbi:unnamed protein product [Dicrocoelium dendriticum]|nr:unnamed protein product [Dicrocoelium dendriticum]
MSRTLRKPARVETYLINFRSQNLSYINRFLRLESTSRFNRPSSSLNESALTRESSPEGKNDQASERVSACRLSLPVLMFPSSWECLFLVISLLVTLVSESFLCCSSGVLLASLHALVTTLLLGITLYVMHLEESDLIGTLQNEIFHRKTA